MNKFALDFYKLDKENVVKIASFAKKYLDEGVDSIYEKDLEKVYSSIKNIDFKSLNSALASLDFFISIDKDGEPQMQEAVLAQAAEEKEFNKLYKSAVERDRRGPLERIVAVSLERILLPSSTVLVRLGHSKIEDDVRFASILSTAFRNELDAESAVFTDGDVVEVEAQMAGSLSTVTRAVMGLSDAIKNAFNKHNECAVRIKGILPNKNSEMQIIDSKFDEESFRKFILKQAGK